MRPNVADLLVAFVWQPRPPSQSIESEAPAELIRQVPAGSMRAAGHEPRGGARHRLHNVHCNLSTAVSRLARPEAHATKIVSRYINPKPRNLPTQARQLRHAGIDHDSEAEEAAHSGAEAPGPETAETDAAGGAAVVTDSGRSYTWLKWTAAGVLFVEGLVGVLVPVCMKLTVHAGWLMSLVNCFAGGVFFTFGECSCCCSSTAVSPCRRCTCYDAAPATPHATD